MTPPPETSQRSEREERAEEFKTGIQEQWGPRTPDGIQQIEAPVTPTLAFGGEPDEKTREGIFLGVLPPRLAVEFSLASVWSRRRFNARTVDLGALPSTVFPRLTSQPISCPSMGQEPTLPSEDLSFAHGGILLAPPPLSTPRA